MKKYILIFSLIFCQFISSAQEPDTLKNLLYAWKLDDGFLEKDVELDTVIDYFQWFNPIEKFGISYTYLGNIGSPFQSNIFFIENPTAQTDFIFERNYYPYLLTKENILFYHAKKPYFNISWTTGTKKRNENQLNALFTQNINKKWNVGVQYKLICSLGEILRSQTKEHSMNFFTSYIGKKYSMHGAFIRNKFTNQENGGANDTASLPELARPFLSSTESIYFMRDFFISQQYKFGYTEKIVLDDTTTETNFIEAGRLNYVISFGKNYRQYYEGSEDTSYYEKTYFYSNDTLDLLTLNKFENCLYWTFKQIKREKFNGRLTLGGTHEYIKYSQIAGNYAAFKTLDYSNVKLSTNLDARTKNFFFAVNGYYYPTFSNKSFKSGSYFGNIIIDKALNIGKWRPEFYLNLSHSSLKPTLFEQKYYSVHFRWENDFKNKIVTDTKFGLKIPEILFNVEVAYGINLNYIYYQDSIFLPTQYADPLIVRSVMVNKDFKLGSFHMRNKLVYQEINNQDDILSLPKWSVYHSFYYDLVKFLDKYSIEAQLGYELYYSTKYYAPGYLPASAQFYQQRIRQTGDYPLLNVFLNMRIKNVLLFFKMENLTNQLVLNKYYYYANNYPINTTAFKFGVSWRFTD